MPSLFPDRRCSGGRETPGLINSLSVPASPGVQAEVRGGGKVGPDLGLAAGPGDVDPIDPGPGAQTEIKPAVGGREVTPAADQVADEHAAGDRRAEPGAEGGLRATA